MTKSTLQQPIEKSKQPSTSDEHTTETVDTVETNTHNVIVESTPTWREKFNKQLSNTIQWYTQWMKALRYPITVHPQYSPMRFTTGLTPVRITFQGWGFCLYNGRIKHFHNTSLLLKMPVNIQTPIIIVGWRQLFKHSLFIDSSLEVISNFSVQSNVTYAVPQVNIATIKSPSLKIEVSPVSIQLPSTPRFQVNTVVMESIRSQLSHSETM